MRPVPEHRSERRTEHAQGGRGLTRNEAEATEIHSDQRVTKAVRRARKQATGDSLIGAPITPLWIIWLIVVATPLTVAAETTVTRPPVSLRLDPCVELSPQAVRRIVALELGARLVAADGSPEGFHGPSTFDFASRSGDESSGASSEVTRVAVRCVAGAVVVEVADAVTGTCSLRRVDLQTEAESARLRTLAVLIVEAVASSWVELQEEPSRGASCASPPPSVPPGADHRAAARVDGMSKRTWVTALGVPPHASGRPDPSVTNGACVSAELGRQLLECPPSSSEEARATPSRMSPSSRVATRVPPSLATPRESAGPEVDRRELKRPRPPVDLPRRRRAARTILLAEVQLTKRLANRTERQHVDHPAVLLRLAGQYEDLAAHAQDRLRLLDEALFSALGNEHRGRSKQLSVVHLETVDELGRWQRAAAEQYRRFAADHRDHPLRGEVLYRRGALLAELADSVHRRSGGEAGSASSREAELREASRGAHRALLRDHSSSRWAPLAYLAFAEDEERSRGFATAVELYDRALEATDSPIWAYLVYRRAWCQLELGRDREAVADFLRVIEGVRHAPSAALAGVLSRAARAELIGPYARAHGSVGAWAFFRHAVGTHAPEMMAALGDYFFDAGQWGEAGQIYRALLAAESDAPGRCHWQARVAEVTRRAPQAIDTVRELRRSVEVMQALEGATPAPSTLRACRSEVAQVLLGTATDWHHEAVGTDEVPGTLDADTMELASGLYDLAIEAFEGIERLELRGWDAATGPTDRRIRFWASELLYQRQRWSECGPAYEAVVATGPRDALYREAAHGAAFCWDQVLRQRESLSEPPSTPSEGSAEQLSRPLTDRERTMDRAFARWACLAPEGEDLAPLLFRRAAIRGAARRHDEEALLLGALVDRVPEHVLALQAIQLQAEALLAVSRRASNRREACEAQVEGIARRALGVEWVSNNYDLRQYFSQVQCGIMWSQAERHASSGDYERCAELYLEIYRDFGTNCSRIGEHGLDEVLYNAAICLESDYRIGPAIQVRRRLIDLFGQDLHGLPGEVSPWAGRALYQIGGNYQAIAAYTQAARHYESFARQYPEEPEAPEALREATAIRLALGQRAEAARNSSHFERSYGRRLGATTVRVMAAVGELCIHQKRWADAERHYGRLLKRYRGRMPMDVEIVARVNLGQTRRKLGGVAARGSDALLHEAIALANRGHVDGESAQARVQRYRRLLADSARSGNVGDPDLSRRLVRMASALAEARFLLAESAADRFAAIELPPFRPGSRLTPSTRAFWTARVGRERALRWEHTLRYMTPRERQRQLVYVQFWRWTSDELIPWGRRREAARRVAERAYMDTVHEGVPRWEIAASARIGELLRDTLRTYYEISIPLVLREDDELRPVFESRLDDAAAPYRQAAISAFEHCLNVATENRWFDARSRGCERHLNELSPRDYPLSDEFRATPSLQGPLLAVPSVVTDLGPDITGPVPGRSSPTDRAHH